MCTLTRFGLFVKTEACWFEALLIFVGISSKWLDIHVRIGSQSCVSRHGELTMIIVEWILQRRHILLRHLSPAQVYEVIKSLYKEEAKPVAVTNDDFTLLLHGDGSFVGQEAVDDSVRLSTFIFGSLTRPPETHCVFSFKPWIFMSIDTSIIEKVMEDTH
ncbi:unnamed protein product [Arabidopsis arenosa]|uniref:Uncharacterized protein n=1 Tax=Arabidopsis arenosa TaxID=38785 RepID=A0A8S1ZF21_ARAAE|nr:unnamed protein product [Arabidopsis arenosa]